jgi:hypothetical protein
MIDINKFSMYKFLRGTAEKALNFRSGLSNCGINLKLTFGQFQMVDSVRCSRIFDTF